MNIKQNISVITCLVFSFQAHAFDFNKALGDFSKSVEEFGESIKIKNTGESDAASNDNSKEQVNPTNNSLDVAQSEVGKPKTASNQVGSFNFYSLDVIGLKIGDTSKDFIARTKKHNPVSGPRIHSGIGTAYIDLPKLRKIGNENKYTGRETIKSTFLFPPDKETLSSIARIKEYEAGPEYEAVVNALISKYGEPTFLYNNRFYWRFDKNGNPQPKLASFNTLKNSDKKQLKAMGIESKFFQQQCTIYAPTSAAEAVNGYSIGAMENCKGMPEVSAFLQVKSLSSGEKIVKKLSVLMADMNMINANGVRKRELIEQKKLRNFKEQQKKSTIEL